MGQVIAQYNNAMRFNKTAKGEPIRASFYDLMSGTHTENPKELSKYFALALRPESARTLNVADNIGDVPHLRYEAESVSKGQAPFTYEALKRLEAQKTPGSPRPNAYSIYAMDTYPTRGLPGEDEWWKGLPNKGQDLYSLGYDVLRAAGQANTSHGLTRVNKVRRLYNVGANRMGHGNFGGIAPFEEAVDGQLFNFPLERELAEREYLERLFGVDSSDPKKFKKGAELYDQAMGLTEKKLADKYGRDPVSAQYSDDEMAGLAWLREAQLSGAYGPKNAAGQEGGLRLSDYRPEDTAELRQLVEPFQAEIRARGGKFDPGAAISANALGRQITTEATVKRMLRGETPEEIAADLIQGTPDNAFMGRYRKGGLVAART